MFRHAVKWNNVFSRCYSVQADKAILSKLRKKTGISFINCKKALIKFNNDLEQAEKWLKEQAEKEGWTKASKLQDRPMSQGLLSLMSDKGEVTMIEVNCETDFVARTDKFKNFVSSLTATFHNLHKSIENEKSLLTKVDASQIKVEERTIADLVAQEIGNMGENMQLRRALLYKQTNDLHLGVYMYSSGQIQKFKNCLLGKYGAVVQYKKTNSDKSDDVDTIAQQVAQHIVGFNPKTVGNPNDEPSKDEDNETRLIFQPFVNYPEVTVGEILAENNMTVTDFVRFELGEEEIQESAEQVKETESVSS